MKSHLLFISVFASNYIFAQNSVGIGTTTPIATLEVVRGTAPLGTAAFHGTNFTSHFNIGTTEDTYINGGKAGSHVVLNYAGSGLVGIGTLTPFSPLTFNNNFGEKISLYGNSGNNYGFGITAGILQIHSDAPEADIAFGHGSSTAFIERMRIKYAGTTGTGMELNGRILLRNGTSPLDINYGPGIWLNKADNSALLGFMGVQNNQNLGFYGGPAGWGFTYDAINSRVGIGTPNPGAKLHVSAGDASLALFGPNAAYGGSLYVGASGNQGVALTAQVIATNGNLHIDPAPGRNIYFGSFQPRDVYINPIGGNVIIGSTYPPDATLVVDGYTKLGSDAPSIKFKKLGGYTASTEGASVYIPHGLNGSKILSISVLVDGGLPPNLPLIGYNFFWYYSGGTSIEVRNVEGQSNQILSRPIKILITYEE